MRKSWAGDELHEPPADYRTTEKPLFGHERLDAYRVGLEFVGWFHLLPGGSELSSRRFRQIDKAATSLVLNVAEGNGRCLQSDRSTFLDTAESATVKAAADLELSQRTGEVNLSQLQAGVGLLDRIAGLVHGLADFARSSSVSRSQSEIDTV